MRKTTVNDYAIVTEEIFTEQHPESNPPSSVKVPRNQPDLGNSPEVIQLETATSIDREDSIDDKFL